MRRQGYNDRLDEHLGRRRAHREGKYHQSMASRRHESEGMEKHYGHRKYAADPYMDRDRRHERHERREHHYADRGVHDYDRSRKHRKRESEGMKRYWRDR